MKAEFCEFEESVAAAFFSGQWTDELSNHVARCGHCADLRLVLECLAKAASPSQEAATAPLPAPGLIWWRAQLAERRQQATRAVAAIDFMQKFAVAAALLAVAGVIAVWKPIDWGTVFIGLGLSAGTMAVLFSWARGRI